MVHPNIVPKPIVSTNSKPVDVKVDVCHQFINEQKCVVHNHMLQWIYTEVAKLGFCIVIARSNNSSYRSSAFVTLRCKISGKYTTLIHKLKRYDSSSRKCECPFNLHGYFLDNNK